MHCWFCGRPQTEVEVLITASGAAICEQCIAECVEVLNERPTPPVVIFRADHERRHAAELLKRAGDLATEALALLDRVQAKP